MFKQFFKDYPVASRITIVSILCLIFSLFMIGVSFNEITERTVYPSIVKTYTVLSKTPPDEDEREDGKLIIRDRKSGEVFTYTTRDDNEYERLESQKNLILRFTQSSYNSLMKDNNYPKLYNPGYEILVNIIFILSISFIMINLTILLWNLFSYDDSNLETKHLGILLPTISLFISFIVAFISGELL